MYVSLHIKMDPINGVLDTSVDVRDVERSNPPTLWELGPLLLGDGPQEPLLVLLLDLHQVRQHDQVAGGAAHMEHGIWTHRPDNKIRA